MIKPSGLPSGRVSSIAFDGDYVWASTDNGAARFDRLIEEWEWYGTDKGIPDSNLVKILMVDKYVWFITEKGFSEYDPQFEKWRHFTLEADMGAVISEAFEFGKNLWFLTNKGLIKFNPRLNSQEYFFHPALEAGHLKNMLYESEAIWALSDSKLFYIQSESQVLKEFEANYYLEGTAPCNFNLDAGEIWITTDKNVLQWKRIAKTWKVIDYASGVSDSAYTNAFISGGLTLLVNKVIIDYRLTDRRTLEKIQADNRCGFRRG